MRKKSVLELRLAGRRARGPFGVRGYLDLAATASVDGIALLGWLEGSVEGFPPASELRLGRTGILEAKSFLQPSDGGRRRFLALLRPEDPNPSARSHVGPLRLALQGVWHDLPGSYHCPLDPDLGRLFATLDALAADEPTAEARDLLTWWLGPRAAEGDRVAGSNLSWEAPHSAPATDDSLASITFDWIRYPTPDRVLVGGAGEPPPTGLRLHLPERSPISLRSRPTPTSPGEDVRFLAEGRFEPRPLSRRDCPLLEIGEGDRTRRIAIRAGVRPDPDPRTAGAARWLAPLDPEADIVVTARAPGHFGQLAALVSSLAGAGSGATLALYSGPTASSVEAAIDLGSTFGVRVAWLETPPTCRTASALDLVARQVDDGWLVLSIGCLFERRLEGVRALVRQATDGGSSRLVVPTVAFPDGTVRFGRCVLGSAARPTLDLPGRGLPLTFATPESGTPTDLAAPCVAIRSTTYLALGGFARLYDDLALELADLGLRAQGTGGRVETSPERVQLLSEPIEDGLRDAEPIALARFRRRWARQLGERTSREAAGLRSAARAR